MKKYYKGNLHTHSTRSDGGKTPEEIIELYKSNGYDFLAFTDHYIFSEEKRYKDFLVVGGCEYDTGSDAKDGAIYHIVGLGMKTDPGFERSNKPDPQTIISGIKKSGGMAVLAHPAWSLNRAEKIEKLEGFDFVEIYNSVSGVPYSTRPYSGEVVDQLAMDGYYWPLIAVDDSHFYKEEACLSYIMVECDELTEDNILSAIKKGDYYSTQGPEISYEIKDNILTVYSTPVDIVKFNTNNLYVHDRVTRGKNITTAQYSIKYNDRFVRFEVTDENGKSAWSNIILVNE